MLFESQKSSNRIVKLESEYENEFWNNPLVLNFCPIFNMNCCPGWINVQEEALLTPLSKLKSNLLKILLYFVSYYYNLQTSGEAGGFNDLSFP